MHIRVCKDVFYLFERHGDMGEGDRSSQMVATSLGWVKSSILISTMGDRGSNSSVIFSCHAKLTSRELEQKWRS